MIWNILNYKQLFFYLTWRDVVVRYKQTVIGIVWAFVRPAFTMLAFTLIFGRIANLPSDGESPYAMMVFAGLLPWQLFSMGVQQCSDSLVSNSQLISKIYFPRIIIPVSSVITSMVDFFISLFVFVLLSLFLTGGVNLKIIYLPFFMIISVILVLGLGLIFGSLNVYFRDFRYIVGFILQFGIYISPVGFSYSIIPSQWKLLYSINPMVGIIEGFRWCLLPSSNDLDLVAVLISASISFILLITGFVVFGKLEKKFSDII